MSLIHIHVNFYLSSEHYFELIQRLIQNFFFLAQNSKKLTLFDLFLLKILLSLHYAFKSFFCINHLRVHLLEEWLCLNAAELYELLSQHIKNWSQLLIKLLIYLDFDGLKSLCGIDLHLRDVCFSNVHDFFNISHFYFLYKLHIYPALKRGKKTTNLQK